MTKSTKDIISALAVIAICIFALIFFPIFTITAINLLFATGIPVTFYTWLATVWLTAIFAPVKYAFKKD